MVLDVNSIFINIYILIVDLKLLFNLIMFKIP